MNLGPLIGLIIVIVIISAVVGAIAQFLNKLSEMNAQQARRPMGGAPARGEGGGTVRQSSNDMDRFLAEIDRLRKRNTEAPGQQPVAPTATARPTAKPQPDRPRPRVVAELAEAQPRPPEPAPPYNAPQPAPAGFGGAYATSPPAPTQPTPRPQDLPVATVVVPTAATGTPGATRVTRLPQRARPVAKTNLAHNLTGLLNSGQGIAMAVILQEVLGPPKCKKRGDAGPAG
jgi:hypothetical protein